MVLVSYQGHHKAPSTGQLIPQLCIVSQLQRPEVHDMGRVISAEASLRSCGRLPPCRVFSSVSLFCVCAHLPRSPLSEESTLCWIRETPLTSGPHFS